MAEYYSYKRCDAWLWQVKFTRAEILDRYGKGAFADLDWEVCPLGCAKYAVPMAEFINDPSACARVVQQDHLAKERRNAVVAAVEQPTCLKLGAKSVQACLLALMLGGAIVNVFFSHLKGAGIPPALWFLLIPIWSIGAVGIVLVIFGWIQHRIRIHRAVKQSQRENRSNDSDGR